MRTMTLCTAMVLLVPVTCIHAADAPLTLDGLKAIYEKAQASIDADYSKQKADALEGYGKALDAYLAQFKQQGKLADYLAIEKEKKRFTAEKTIPAVEARSGEHITLAAKNYEDAVAKAEADKQAKTADLIGKYTARLDLLIKDLMKADKIADAKAVQDEKQRVEFILATIPAAARAIVKTEATPEQTPVAVSPVTTASRPQPKPVRTAGKYVVTKEIAIDSRSETGYELGAIKKGDEIELQYISGKWTHDPHGAALVSPDGEHSGLTGVKLVTVLDGRSVMLAVLPMGTANTPFRYRFGDDYDRVALRMTDTLLSDNAGSVTYKLTTRTANPLETEGQAAAPVAPAGTVSQPQPKPDTADVKHKKVTDGIVIWNSHNSRHGGYGVRRLSVICLSAGREVWKKKDVSIEWEPDKDSFSVVYVPVVSFDTVRVEITQHVGHGGSLSEIQVLRRGVNVAAGCAVTASSVFRNLPALGADKLTDGVTTSERDREGYWVTDDEPKAWVEVNLGNKGK